jgi:hypothetical protein
MPKCIVCRAQGGSFDRIPSPLGVAKSPRAPSAPSWPTLPLARRAPCGPWPANRGSTPFSLRYSALPSQLSVVCGRWSHLHSPRPVQPPRLPPPRLRRWACHHPVKNPNQVYKSARRCTEVYWRRSPITVHWQLTPTSDLRPPASVTPLPREMRSLSHPPRFQLWSP